MVVVDTKSCLFIYYQVMKYTNVVIGLVQIKSK